MSKFNFSLRTLLLTIAVVAVYFPLRNVYEPWRRHRLQNSHQIFSDFETLALLNEGDSVQDVTRYYPMLSALEPGSPAWNRVANALRSSKLSVGPTDEIYKYTLNEPGMFGYLQFRNGNLINHPRDQFSNPVANATRSGASLPSLIDRIGFIPIYLSTIAMVCTIFLVAKRLIREWRSSASDNRNNPKAMQSNGG